MNIVGNRTLRLALEQKAEAFPDKTFLIFEHPDEQTSSYTFSQLDQMVNRTANALLSMGVKKGDKVNLHLTNCPEFLFTWWAAAKIGAVTVPTNPLSPPDELSYPVQHSESVISVTQPDLLPTVEAIRDSCPDLRQVVLCGADEAPSGVVPFSELVEGQPDELDKVPLVPEDEAAIMYTSGTTSRPKGVLVTHANYIWVGEVVSKLMRLTPDDRQLVTLPLYHANAMYYSVTTALIVGASVALMPRFSATRFMKQATRHECTVTSLFAAPMRMILAQPEDAADKENQLRLVIFAQNVTEAQLDEWHARFGAPLMQIYGMTETMGQPVTNPLDYTRNNMAMGMPTLGYESRIVDDEGRDVGVGVPGQLLVSGIPGRTIMKGYFKNPEATAETIRDGWLWTGDVVQADEQGYIHFCGPDQGFDQTGRRERRGRGGGDGHQDTPRRGGRRRYRGARPHAGRDYQGLRHSQRGPCGHGGGDRRVLQEQALQVPCSRVRGVSSRLPTHFCGEDAEAHYAPGGACQAGRSGVGGSFIETRQESRAAPKAKVLFRG